MNHPNADELVTGVELWVEMALLWDRCSDGEKTAILENP